MNRRVLFVDDDENILDAFSRVLRKRFTLDTATGGAEALERVARDGPYAVVMADMRMPGMNGIELLAALKQRCPDTVRMMLTGNADLQTAIDAVNEGEIFRFLSKPAAPEQIARALEAGIAQHRLITAERELLEKTLAGSVHALTEVLALVNPAAFGRTNRLKGLVEEVAALLEPAASWEIRTAAMLSQLGCVVLDETTVKKLETGEAFTDEEHELFEMHPMVGADLLGGIPRLEPLLEIIRYQEKDFDGGGTPRDEVHGEAIPLGSRILRAVLDFDRYQSQGLSREAALGRLRSHAARYDPAVLEALESAVGARPHLETVDLSVDQLEDGMIVAEEIRNSHGVLLICKGQETTATVRQRLRAYEENSHGPGRLRVTVLSRARYRGVAPSGAAVHA